LIVVIKLIGTLPDTRYEGLAYKCLNIHTAQNYGNLIHNIWTPVEARSMGEVIFFYSRTGCGL
jgi:hypothetical protein